MAAPFEWFRSLKMSLKKVFVIHLLKNYILIKNGNKQELEANTKKDAKYTAEIQKLSKLTKRVKQQVFVIGYYV